VTGGWGAATGGRQPDVRTTQKVPRHPHSPPKPRHTTPLKPRVRPAHVPAACTARGVLSAGGALTAVAEGKAPGTAGGSAGQGPGALMLRRFICASILLFFRISWLTCVRLRRASSALTPFLKSLRRLARSIIEWDKGWEARSSGGVELWKFTTTACPTFAWIRRCRSPTSTFSMSISPKSAAMRGHKRYAGDL
jgi:hypothetical protein